MIHDPRAELLRYHQDRRRHVAEEQDEEHGAEDGHVPSGVRVPSELE